MVSVTRTVMSVMHCSVSHTNVCVGPETGRLCSECGGQAVLSGNWPSMLPVRDCLTDVT